MTRAMPRQVVALATHFLVGASIAATSASMASAVHAEGAAESTPAVVQAQAGKLRVLLSLTDDEAAVRREWETAVSSPQLRVIDRARAGDRISTVLVFEGCAIAADGACRLVVRFELLTPDGNSVAAGSGVLWSSPPLAGRMMLGAASATIPIGPKWTIGDYAVRVGITDEVGCDAVTLLARLKVVP